MRDAHGRAIHYLRVSVTDRCNLRCRYCLPPEGVLWLPRSDILSLEEIAEVVEVAVEMGVDKVRLTGGEPLLRRNLVNLVARLSTLPGIRDLAMTTNGTLLRRHAGDLARAGLQRVNVSLDTMDAGRYRSITGGGDLAAVLDGIQAAREAGLAPLKLNCVVAASPDEPDARGVAEFARAEGLPVRFIPQMDLRAGTFGVVEEGGGGDCPRCNRLRLTCDGQVRPCLFSDLAFSVRELGARTAFERALGMKPAEGAACRDRQVQYIGG